MGFEAIIGHQQQILLLENAIQHQRVAHAYLFDGPDGIGKKQVAQIFARIILCENSSACGHCNACANTAAGSHPDFHAVQAEGDSIKIEQIRALQAQLVLRSFSGRGKICLIDDAELMTREAANALLKTLEEPAAGTFIILISSHPEVLLPTILSRCQKISFSRLPAQELARHLCQELSVTPAAATVLAAVSDGSISKALGQNQDLYLKKRVELIQALSALSATSTIQTFEFAQYLKGEKDLLDEILGIFEIFFRDLLLHKQGQPQAAMINQDLMPLIQQQVEMLSTPQILTKIEAVDQARRYLARNINIHLAMDHMLMQITHA